VVDDAGGAKLGNIRRFQVERLEAKLAVERGLRCCIFPVPKYAGSFKAKVDYPAHRTFDRATADR